MTTQGNVMYLIVFVSLIFKSEQNCKTQYFNEKTLQKYIHDSITLVQTANPKDVIECTLEKECQNKGNDLKRQLRSMLRCYDNDMVECRNTPKCQNSEPYMNVSFYHFLCLTAKDLNFSDAQLGHIGCQYSAVCPLYGNISKATTLPERTTAAPTTSLPSTPLGSTAGAAGSQSKLENGACLKDTCELENILKVLLALSLLLNLVFLLGLLWHISRRRRPKQQMCQSSVPNGINLENRLLTEAQHQEYQSELTHDAEQNGQED
ncbi:uncharacterized protein LOC109997545 isoform X2 [Xyrichtys novacula]|uniref:Uncharacterized protein LOC109997545 isoform X2 n=1 Tax=Xyrichtys novacula TaxID=13765 RepID=A0AAV1GTT8_XYRNO|nr:uncharacterized protein LOC109997545 isoform X2 [Xyrichtys novacula]